MTTDPNPAERHVDDVADSGRKERFGTVLRERIREATLAALSEVMPDGGQAWDQRELMGVGEAADVLGVSKQRVHQLLRAPGFPEPVARLKATPVWYGRDIRAYALCRELALSPVDGS